mmetsp:Transcript_9074/g.11520  ORF Transcript_9074/g.11520 Transcript_9074/m.11520 type:complete len:85 (+) Transcript_9074:443-697(+)
MVVEQRVRMGRHHSMVSRRSLVRQVLMDKRLNMDKLSQAEHWVKRARTDKHHNMVKQVRMDRHRNMARHLSMGKLLHPHMDKPR